MSSSLSASAAGDAAASSGSPHPSHISTKLRNASPSEPFWSLEFFPPKTQQGLSNLYARVARMRTDLKPAWIQVTWGAGGTTQETSFELAGRIQQGKLNPLRPLKGRESTPREREEENILAADCCLHLTCTNVTKESLDSTLDEAVACGIRNILALRGDPPRGEEYWVAADERFQHAEDLVRYVRQRHGDFFCLGVAGYPEGHSEHVQPDVATDIKYLLSKQAAGADFIVTQLFYCVDTFLGWYKQCREAGVTIPIIPGIMPIQNYQSFRRMTNLCKVRVPDEVLDALEPIKHDDAAVKDYGVRHAMHLIGRLFLESDIRGFHFCTLNLEKSVRRVLEGLGWVQTAIEPEAGVGANGSTSATAPTHATASHGPGAPTSPQLKRNLMLENEHCSSKTAPADLQISAAEALRQTLARASLLRPPVAGPPPQQTATWDEFTNGRYGDSRSPAFGELDGYGVSLKVPASDALRLWGHPTSEADISALFVNYLEGRLSGIPWCDVPIFNETRLIQQELLTLNRAPAEGGKGWWTVGSQPAIDGVESGDATFGFGPRGGYIFQKPFVELFVSEEEKEELRRRADDPDEEEAGFVSFFAGNRKGEFESNLVAGDVSAVTWGVFPGQEIAQSTIIEEQSFKAWSEEAFAIWGEWELLFPLRSPTRELLSSIGNKRWLVTLVHHDYKRPEALWKFLGCTK